MKTFIVVLMCFLVSLIGCRKSEASYSWYKDTLRGLSYPEAIESLNNYNNVILVCITGDQVKTQLPDSTTLRPFDYLHFEGTVVRSYKGNWKVGDRITFAHGLDYAVSDRPVNKRVGELMFVFTNLHTHEAFGVDTGDFDAYRAENDRLFQSLRERNTK